MRGKILSVGLKTTLAIFALAVFTLTLFVAEASAGTIKVLHNFNGTDGSGPTGLIFDGSGNLYGITHTGGNSNVGLAFELTPTVSGHWNEKTLIEFNHATGAYPNPIIFDSVGNLYGTLGGIAPHGTGAVFELLPTADGQWNEKILYVMENSEGIGPNWSVTFDTFGNIFSTASAGGRYNAGTIFELSPTTDGNWQGTVIESMNGKDGGDPQGNVIFDAAGNMYGTDYNDGAHNAGTVWELTPQTDGTWTETVLYSFAGKTDRGLPFGGVIFDTAGNLYGTTSAGGAFGVGTVFELSPNPAEPGRKRFCTVSKEAVTAAVPAFLL